NEVSILEDPTGRKNALPRKRDWEEAPEKKAPSVQIAQSVGESEAGTNLSTY
ncbi:hypothetical protein KI387_044344, partial [Taxus chinensis]